MSTLENLQLLRDKTIVVTGCASGIGLETARLIGAMGGTVLGVDVNTSLPHADAFYYADLSDPESIDALVEALPSEIDGLANIAGLPPTAPADKVLRVNLVGLKYLTESLLPKLADGASIVNLASLASNGWTAAVPAIRASYDLTFAQVDDFIRQHQVGNEGGRSYFFSKEALLVWTMNHRWTWRDRDIRMNAVSPGPVDTPILDDFVQTLGNRAAQNKRLMDRPGRPEDVAPVVAFLLSDMTHWIRGTNIPVDGGMASHLVSEAYGL